MSNSLAHARAVATWCMSMLTLGAWSIVSGAAMTIPNGALLAAACVVPPLFMLLVWRRSATPVALEQGGVQTVRRAWKEVGDEA